MIDRKLQQPSRFKFKIPSGQRHISLAAFSFYQFFRNGWPQGF
jgi:hypothetical protein